MKNGLSSVVAMRFIFHAQGWDVVATMRTPREDINATRACA